jgi:hypothetical protein
LFVIEYAKDAKHKMKDWKKDLENKVKDFNLTEGGESNVHIGSDSRINSRVSNRRSGGSVHLPVNKEINNTIKVNMKGGLIMITVEGALKDLEAIEATATDSGAKSVVQALKVVVKFLSTIRSNQLLTDEDRVRIKKEKADRKPVTKA